MQKGKEFIDSLNRAADDGEKLTVGNWIRNWLENYAKPNVRPRTYEKYSGTLKAYILPVFENVLLNELTAADLQKHLNRLLETGRTDGTGLSSSTVRGTRRYLSMCIDDAVKSGLVFTKAPKLSKKEIAVLSKDEIARLINAAKEIDHQFMSVVMPQIISLTVHTGMRQGEVFGLKWEDVDFEKSCLFTS
ncbi:MAG: tyrosine-type recombinase/integrase [Selenomonadaceae bacterium]|nr:tyrosine-type recombinase/integrase [Selenomonadaceae bacterium]